MNLTREEYDALEWVEVKYIEPIGKVYDHNGNEVTYEDVEYCECCGHEIEKDDD